MGETQRLRAHRFICTNIGYCGFYHFSEVAFPPYFEKEEREQYGSAQALDSPLCGYRAIIVFGVATANFEIGRLPRGNTTRLYVWGSVCRFLLYMAQENRPYCNDERQVIRGLMTMGDMITRRQDSHIFTRDSGMGVKIHTSLLQLTGEPRRTSVYELRRIFSF